MADKEKFLATFRINLEEWKDFMAQAKAERIGVTPAPQLPDLYPIRDRVTLDGKTFQQGPMFVDWEASERVTQPYPIVLVHDIAALCRVPNRFTLLLTIAYINVSVLCTSNLSLSSPPTGAYIYNPTPVCFR